MFYTLIRPLARVAIQAFYQKIYFSNLDRVPRDKPVILAANHPTAFVEPCVLACFMDQPLYFLVRGDLFRKKFYADKLRQLNMLPVYRMKDGGFQNLRNNFSTFDSCYQTLKENKPLMILAEGRTIHEKRLRPIRKGTGRIALGALDKYPELEDIYIIPVGVNYTYADQARSEIMIDFGEPLLARDYWDAYQTNPQQAINDLTQDLTKGLQKNVIIIEQEADEVFVEQLFLLFRSENPFPHLPVAIRDEKRLAGEKTIANWVNQLENTAKEAWKNRVAQYFKALDRYSIIDRSLVQNHPAVVLHGILLVLGFSWFLVGFLLNAPPVKIAHHIAKTRVKFIEFYAPVWLATSLGAYLLWWPFLLLLFSLLGGATGFLFALTIPFFGRFALFYREFFENWRENLKIKRLKKDVLRSLRAEREKLIDGLRLELGAVFGKR